MPNIFVLRKRPERYQIRGWCEQNGSGPLTNSGAVVVVVVTLTDQDRARVFAGHKSGQEAEARNGWRRYVQSNLVAGRLQ